MIIMARVIISIVISINLIKLTFIVRQVLGLLLTTGMEHKVTENIHKYKCNKSRSFIDAKDKSFGRTWTENLG